MPTVQNHLHRDHVMQWEAIIGLEVHVQLATQSKLFSGASTAYGAEPNTQASLVDLGFPGTLPVLNEEAVRLAVKFGLSIDAEINQRSVFARKNYFYPDLPKGYQISQYDLPIVGKGSLTITLEDGSERTIPITRAHLEEDAGKSLHESFHQMTGIDLNRAGTPLLEIVSEPELYSAKEAVAYLKTLHSLVRYLGVSDGNMQEGSFRCDVNVSVRRVGDKKLGIRTEIKNVNSFRFVERAIHYEIQRQIELLEAGGQVIQETRLYDAEKNMTRSMRSKEEAQDYRYFPDPDLLPLVIHEDFIAQIRQNLPELPWEKQKRFIEQFHLSRYDASILAAQRELADYFEAVIQAAPAGNAKLIANWVIGEVLGALNKAGLDITDCPVHPTQLATIIARMADNTISGKIAKSIFEATWNGEGDPDQIIEQRGLKQITDVHAIEQVIDEILLRHSEQVAQYRQGKEALFGFFVGQVMKATQGKANPQHLNQLLKQKLSE